MIGLPLLVRRRSPVSSTLGEIHLPSSSFLRLSSEFVLIACGQGLAALGGIVVLRLLMQASAVVALLAVACAMGVVALGHAEWVGVAVAASALALFSGYSAA